MRKLRLYRFDHEDSSKWIWYNSEWKYNCVTDELKSHPMPYEPEVYKWIYRSSVKNGKDMAFWVTREVAEKMLKNWFVFCRYLSDDYFYRDHGEICFNKTNYYKREVLSLDKLYD